MFRKSLACALVVLFAGSALPAAAFEKKASGRLSRSLVEHPCMRNWDTRVADCMETLMRARPKSTEFQRLLDRATVAVELADYGLAKRELDAAFQLGRPSVADLHFSSRLHITMQPVVAANLDRAAEDIDKALKMKPEDANLWVTMAEVAWFRGHASKRLLALDKALSIDANHTYALWQRASMMLESNRPIEAEADLTQLLMLAPTHASAYEKRAELYAGQGKLEAAEADVDKAIQHGPKLERYWLRVGIREARGNTAGAIADLTMLHDEFVNQRIIVHPKFIGQTLVKRALLQWQTDAKEAAGVDLINSLRFLDKPGLLRVQAFLAGWGADVPIDAKISAPLGAAVHACIEDADCVEDLAAAILTDNKAG